MDLGGEGGGNRHKKKRKGRRLGVRMDMTPMVDVAFLLLTFFMLTTVFSRPQAMEINLPETDEPIEIAQSKVLTLRGAEDGRVYYNRGDAEVESIPYSELNGLLVRERQALGDELIVLLMVDRRGEYVNIVDMLDEVKLAGVTKFSISSLTPRDSTLIVEAQAGS